MKASGKILSPIQHKQLVSWGRLCRLRGLGGQNVLYHPGSKKGELKLVFRIQSCRVPRVFSIFMKPFFTEGPEGIISVLANWWVLVAQDPPSIGALAGCLLLKREV